MIIGDVMAPVIARLTEQAEAIGELRAERNAAAAARAEVESHRLAAEQARRDEAAQADQLVNLLEGRIRELEQMVRGGEDRQA